eukprot:RCo004379
MLEVEALHHPGHPDVPHFEQPRDVPSDNLWGAGVALNPKQAAGVWHEVVRQGGHAGGALPRHPHPRSHVPAHAHNEVVSRGVGQRVQAPGGCAAVRGAPKLVHDPVSLRVDDLDEAVHSASHDPPGVQPRQADHVGDNPVVGGHDGNGVGEGVFRVLGVVREGEDVQLTQAVAPVQPAGLIVPEEADVGQAVVALADKLQPWPPPLHVRLKAVALVGLGVDPVQLQLVILHGGHHRLLGRDILHCQKGIVVLRHGKRGQAAVVRGLRQRDGAVSGAIHVHAGVHVSALDVVQLRAHLEGLRA